MKTFNAIKYEENELILKSGESLEELYKTIKNEEDFIIKTKEIETIIIATNISAKVTNGEIILKTGGENE